MDFANDALRSRHEGVVESSVKGTIASHGPADANHRHNQGGNTEDEERHLTTGARQERLNPFTLELVAERHDYFSFGASAKR